jgi:hypothetical protein
MLSNAQLLLYEDESAPSSCHEVGGVRCAMNIELGPLCEVLGQFK